MEQSNLIDRKLFTWIVKTVLVIVKLSVLLCISGCRHKSRGENPSTEIYKAGGVNFVMKKIEAVKGGKLGDDSHHNNKVHKVNLNNYLIGETEVTQELFKAIMNKNPSAFSDLPEKGEVQAQRPAEQVSWYDCILFCNELTKKMSSLGGNECVYYSDENYTAVYTEKDAGKKKLPYMKMEKKGFRLPTEAEWEWAARGGKEDKWAGTNEKDELKDYVWFNTNSGDKTHEVKKKKPNGYGLYDMSGNVWEWCWDWSGNDRTDGDNPTGPASGTHRTIRGGGWNCSPFRGEVSYPSFTFSTADYLGFRLVRRP